MCGINGVVFKNGVTRDAGLLNQIKFLFDELMVETQARGEHATGVVAFKRDGSYEFHKAAKNAVEITTKDTEFQSIVNNFDNETSVVIAHTRYYTKGKPTNNLNNHPFDIGNIVGVHNGTVSNDDYLFNQNKDNFKRLAEVDSEVIYQLINHHNHDGITIEGLRNALEKTYLRGLFALAFAHKNDPTKVHIVKQEKPMSLAYWKEAGLVIFNSQDDFIKNAFAKLERAGKRWGFQTSITVEYLTMKDDTYITIDANATVDEAVISEPKKMYILSSATKSYYGKGADTSYTRGNTGTGKSSGAVGSSTRSLAAADSIGRVIEGELDELTGEVTIFTTSIIAGATQDPQTTDCTECGNELSSEEKNSAYNEGAKQNKAYVCSTCYQKALTQALEAKV